MPSRLKVKVMTSNNVKWEEAIFHVPGGGVQAQGGEVIGFGGGEEGPGDVLHAQGGEVMGGEGGGGEGGHGGKVKLITNRIKNFRGQL